MPQIRTQQATDADAFHGLPPFGKIMVIWTQWIKLQDEQETGGDGNLQDTKDFMRTGEAVEVMINDLPRYQWWAIRKSRGICTVWNFPNVSLVESLQKAEEALTPKMQKHIATRRYFD